MRANGDEDWKKAQKRKDHRSVYMDTLPKGHLAVCKSVWPWHKWHNGTVANQDTEYEVQESPKVDEVPKILLKEEKYLYIIQIAIIKESSNNYHFFR